MAGCGPNLNKFIDALGLGVAEFADVRYQLVQDMGLILGGAVITQALVCAGKCGQLIVLGQVAF